jgi:Domain of unknown function (DUF5655)
MRLLRERTGKNVDAWNRRVKRKGFTNEPDLRTWLTEQGVTGYPQSLIVMERFGYPDYLLASAEKLIGAQYSDRPHLRPILDAIIHAAAGLGKVVVQARKGYVSLVAPGRTFARVQATTKDRIDLCLRLKNQPPAGLLCPSKRHEHMDHEIRLTATDELHSEVLRWLQEAYKQNS